MRSSVGLSVALVAVTLALGIWAVPAHAGWSEQPTLVEAFYGGNANSMQGQIVRDANGDFFLLLVCPSYALMAQRVRADGAALWPYYLELANNEGDYPGNYPMQHVIAPDGQGGIFSLGDDCPIGPYTMAEALTHANAAGVLDWGANPLRGIVLWPGQSIEISHDLLADSAGVWVAYSPGGPTPLRLERFVGPDFGQLDVDFFRT